MVMLPLQILEGSEYDDNNDSNIVTTATTRQLQSDFTIIDPSRFHNWLTLVKTTIIAMRFLQILRKNSIQGLEELTLSEPSTGKDYNLITILLLRQLQSQSLSSQDIQRWELKQDEN